MQASSKRRRTTFKATDQMLKKVCDAAKHLRSKLVCLEVRNREEREKTEKKEGRKETMKRTNDGKKMG